MFLQNAMLFFRNVLLRFALRVDDKKQSTSKIVRRKIFKCSTGQLPITPALDFFNHVRKQHKSQWLILLLFASSEIKPVYATLNKIALTFNPQDIQGEIPKSRPHIANTL